LIAENESLFDRAASFGKSQYLIIGEVGKEEDSQGETIET
jgi:hypothetical protein